MSDNSIQMNDYDEQYVYIMSNPSFSPDILKIGWTKEHPNTIANKLYTLEIPTPFVVEYVIITSDGSKLEKQIYEYLKKYRIDPDRDFFKIQKNELSRGLTCGFQFVCHLNIELKSINDVDRYIVSKQEFYQNVNEIKVLYEKVKAEINDFFNNLNKDKSELVITTNIDGKKHVSFRVLKTNHNVTSLELHGFEGIDEKYIKDSYYFINKDIKRYEKWFDSLNVNYAILENKIGVVYLRRDNITFRQMILDTYKNFCNLKNKYVWDF